ncbi:NIF3 [Candida pseudojiufengensis]|uniref:NIF3 n=1 Tax=Candida pseudojiufengensis TaxID=497109 RepID=UPI0022243E0C|nr:NIF3 [Candida pseudojiufengensis]KAI5965831.1 NIF3 [Candida pseudojiufengensis]
MSKASVKRVVNTIQKFYPISLADKSWDNTGLLVDSSINNEDDSNISSNSTSSNSLNLKILLTIDLTQSVTNEAISKNCKFIMSYHPFIFRGLKSINQIDPQQKSLIKIIQNQISVYSPHTAVDSAYGGVNDYLVQIITNNNLNLKNSKPIKPNLENSKCGMGRIIELKDSKTIYEIVDLVKSGLKINHLQVAISNNGINQNIKTIAICAGSGGDVFKGVKADLYFTGELSHHETLFYKESGSHVICCNHSNTERAFLYVIQRQLIDELNIDENDVIVSETDKDPFTTW